MRNIGRSMTGAKALGKKTYIGPLMSADFACHKTIDMKGPVTEVLSLDLRWLCRRTCCRFRSMSSPQTVCVKTCSTQQTASVGPRYPPSPSTVDQRGNVLIGMTRWPARPQPADRNDPAPASLMRRRLLQHPVATQWLGIRPKVPASTAPSTPTASGDPCVTMTPKHVPGAVDVDRATRTGLRGIGGEVFLHRSGVPLGEVGLSTA